MKTQIITFALLLATLGFTSCKNSETTAPETPVAIEAPAQAEPAVQAPESTAKDSAKANEKEAKEANEKNEKNEKE